MTSLELRQIQKSYGAYHALRGIAMVFQSYALYPHMTVAENMGFGLRMAHRPKEEIGAAVMRAAKILRITDQLDKRPKQLSGGRRQRVAIGRAITRSPDVFLFDEPLSNLDAALRAQMRVELSSLHAKLGATMVYVTHDQIEAMTMASRIVVLNHGAIEQVGSPLELYRNPENLFVAGFLGAPRMNFFSVTVDAVSGRGATVSTAGLAPLSIELAENVSVQPGDALTMGIRPENLSVVAERGTTASLSGNVRLVEHLGRETILYVDAGALQCVSSESGTGNVTVQIGHVTAVSNDAVLGLGVDPRDVYLFSSGDERTISARKSIIAD
ncbi:ABC transporter ATP-binding protein [Pararhizobium capsulatum]|nr:ABC transporter ATP-binding protein [Pararhizobium capsulatum]